MDRTFGEQIVVAINKRKDADNDKNVSEFLDETEKLKTQSEAYRDFLQSVRDYTPKA